MPDWRARLRAAIERSGRKHSAIARDAGVAPETLSRILNNKHADPALDTVARIAHALDENVAWLLDERPLDLSHDEWIQLHRVIRLLSDAAARGTEEPQTNSAAPVASRVEIPRAYAARGARAAYQACGESMLGAGITDGDLLFVETARTLCEAADRIVVCRIDGALHVRLLIVRGKRIRLLSRNEGYAPIEVDITETQVRGFELIGIVVGRTSG